MSKSYFFNKNILEKEIVSNIRLDMPPPIGYQLVWSDEFDGTTLNSNKWSIAYGNASVSNSILTLGPNTGEIVSRTTTTPKISKFKFRYGYIETKMRFAFDPQNPTIFRRTHRTGPWLGNSPERIGDWGGELDITETGSGPSQTDTTACGGNKINTTIHRFLNSSPYSGPNYTSKGKRYAANFNLSSDYHILGFEWTPDFVRAMLDGIEILKITKFETPIPEAYLYPIIGLCPRCWPLYGPDNPYTSPCSSDVPTGREIALVDYIRIYQLGPVQCPIPVSALRIKLE